MAGVKGMKGGGGPRPNSGGARPGAGRKPKPKPGPTPIEGLDMLGMLQAVALGRVEATPLQVRAAIAAVQYTHMKRGDGGKRDEQAKKADSASGGKYAPSAPPKLIVNNR